MNKWCFDVYTGNIWISGTILFREATDFIDVVVLYPSLIRNFQRFLKKKKL